MFMYYIFGEKDDGVCRVFLPSDSGVVAGLLQGHIETL